MRQLLEKILEKIKKTYRGKNLGTSVTAEQYAAIEAGTFEDLYIGDYWVINDVNWRIAAFDYYLTTGDTACTTHHVTIVPDTNLDTQQMNSSSTLTLLRTWFTRS